MLRIAICDDLPKDLDVISAYTNEYLESHRLIAEVKQFGHPDRLLTASETERFHIYILDIVMPMINGIDIGKQIRQLDREAQIIYVSTEPGFALQSFTANPINYLLKPIDKQKLFDTLTLSVTKANMGEETCITIKTKIGLRTLLVSEISYCEYSHRTVKYFLVSGEQVETCTLSCRFSEHIAPLLESGYFLQPHVSFAVNLKRVERLDKEEFLLRRNFRVPVSKKLYTTVRDAYLDFRFGREG